MAVYCWGSTTYGELGLGGIEDEQILTPRKMTWPEAPSLIQAACGTMHTLLLTSDGKLYSCGNNDHGQLGQDVTRKRPHCVTSLANYKITQVSCGASHSLVLNEWGQIFSWGSNMIGQLGNEISDVHSIHPNPKIVRELATKHVVQIASGDYHCMVLTNSGELYSWGANQYGQLGLGFNSEKVMKPTHIKSLAGIPFAFIACGSNHSFAVSKSGAIYGWGKNTCGQLGLSDDQSKCYPCQLKTLRSRGVRYISCGEDFTVFLTHDGGVFTCGSGTFGQLGHGGCGNETLPRMVMELMGSTITQISCGKRHTLALVPSRGRVYGFGLGGSGQLGSRGSLNASVPQVVLGPWVSPNGSTLLNNITTGEDNLMTIKRIYSGGDHCFVSLVEKEKNIPPDDCRAYEVNTQILTLTVELIESLVGITNSSQVDIDVLTNIETIFRSQTCMNASFLLSSTNNENLYCTSKCSGLDIKLAEVCFEVLQKVENESVKCLIWDCITTSLLESLIPSPADVETLRIYLILPLYHEFINGKNFLKLHSPFSQSVQRLSKNALKVLTRWWLDTPREYFERLVEIFKSVAYYIIHFHILKRIKTDDPKTKQYIGFEPNLKLALETMSILYQINSKRVEKVRVEVFHIPELTEIADLQEDFLRWSFDKNANGWYLCNYPIVFDGNAKTILLLTDQAIQMHKAVQSAAAQSIMMLVSGAPTAVSQYIILNVSRENLVVDTIRELTQYSGSDLKKPLKIKFHGEEAEDAGGVRKEFFMLLLREILDPKYGMFRQFEDSRLIWFSEDSFEEEVMYQLIGIICGLAIYNFTIINLPFPLALFKKLLKNLSIDLSDLRDLSPTLANSMQSILDYNESDFVETFDLYFEISREVFGETKKILLKPKGDEIQVTLENKQEFVDLYIDFLFNKSVEKHFNGFMKGFMKVCGGRVLEIFTPQELMATVVGNENYDWHVLEEVAEYKNGYTSSDETIQLFWEVFHELTLTEKKNFLLFLTGSDRIPIQGMKEMKIIIQPIKDDKLLPVAHTCFNLLDLPQYKTKEKLRYKLLQAIQQTQGFSLV